ncbi:MAG: hypothetical protein ACW97Z_13940 [Candidatus Hodarchaeales archaeon]|jgi:hypothetical protein
MEKKLRTRKISGNVDITLWKMLPILFLLLLYVMSFVIGSGAPSGGAAPPTC